MVSVSLLAAVAAFNIVLDPGHGGSDPGAVGCSLEEHEINLDVSTRLKDLLVANGQTVSMTRTSNVSVGLSARADFANARGADRFASIHSNSFSDSSANGTETFCHTSGGTSIDMRDRIQREMIEAWGLTNRGGKTADFAVLRETVMPATLSELGFVSNCSVDATFLRDPTRRGQAAQAHLEGIAGHLGFGIGAPPPPQNGELKGVVFHDQGVGTADMSVRIPGAVVRVVGRNGTVNVDGEDASWSFSLPAGTYSIHAEAPGFTPNERACDALDGGGVRFCSIGLFPAPSTGEGEGEGEGEEGEGEEGEGEGEGERSGEGEGEAGVTRVVIRNKATPQVQGGCSSTSSASVAGLALLALLAVRRRKSALVAMILGVSASASAQILSDEQIVAEGVIASARPSPAGTKILISDDHYEGLTVVDVKTKTQTVLSTEDRAGFRAVWASESAVASRVPQAPFGGQPLVLVDAVSGKFKGPYFEHRTLAVVQTDEDKVLLGTRLDENGGLRDARQLSPDDDQCFAPQLAKNGVVAFQCLISGVWVVRDGKATNLGEGAQLALANDGGALVYTVGEDEGHVLVENDLVVVDLTAKELQPKVIQTARLERSPGVSDQRADGSRVVSFLADNNVIVATWQQTKK